MTFLISSCKDHTMLTVLLKERKKREEEAQKELEEEQRLEEERAEQKRLEDIEKTKAHIRSLMPAEPQSDDPDAIKILLKLPNGMRLERLFLKTDSLKVFTHLR